MVERDSQPHAYNLYKPIDAPRAPPIAHPVPTRVAHLLSIVAVMHTRCTDNPLQKHSTALQAVDYFRILNTKMKRRSKDMQPDVQNCSQRGTHESRDEIATRQARDSRNFLRVERR